MTISDMAGSDAVAERPRNRILSALPPTDYARLAQRLEPVSLDLKRVLFDVDQPIEYVYFVETGVVSVVAVGADGSAIEVATVGNEGMIGLPVFHDADRAPLQAVCQIPGTALRISAAAFREEMKYSAALTAKLHHYTQAVFTLAAQGSACNRLHTMTERCARWLLHTHDRVGAAEGARVIPLTHQFLSQMIGVRRATITEAMGALQKARAITYSMGTVTVVDRVALEHESCECYAIIQREFDRLLDKTERARAPIANPLAGIQLSEEGQSLVGDGTPRETDQSLQDSA